MMAYEKITYVVLVVILLVGVGTTAALFMIMQDQNVDYTKPHNYSLDGTSYGESVDGFGDSKFINESEREYVYQFENHVKGLEIPTFTVICNSDKVPNDIYERLGEITVDDKQCTEWTYSVKGVSFTFDIDSNMVVHRYMIESDYYSLTAKQVD